MIYVIDRASVSNTHVMFNASMIEVISLAFPGEKLKVIADGSHIELIKQKLPGETAECVVYQPIDITISSSSGVSKLWEWVKKISNDFKFFKTLLSAVNIGDSVIFLSIPPISFVPFKLIKRNFPSKKVFLVMHGELEYLYFYQNKRERGIGIFYKLLFNLRSKNLRYITLNKIAKKKLVEDGYVKEEQMIEIHHPYLFKENLNTKFKVGIPLTFANVGGLMARKSGQLIFELAEKLKNAILQKQIDIQTIGSVENEMFGFDNGLVTGLRKGNIESSYIDRDMFEEKVANIDFALFFFDHHQFIYRASGALLDIVNFNKPIVALKHPLFTSLFQSVGDFGYLCDSIEDMADLIKNLKPDSDFFKKDYSQFIANINKLKEKLSIKFIANDFKKQL